MRMWRFPWRAPFGALLIAAFCITPALYGVAMFLDSGVSGLAQAPGPTLFGEGPRTPAARIGWLSRSAQREVAADFLDRMPLSRWLVRGANQLDYWVLRWSSALGGHLVLGSQAQIFESGYVDQALGFHGVLDDVHFQRLGQRLKGLAEVLARRDVRLVVLGSPNKVSLHADTLPSGMRARDAGKAGNYGRMIQALTLAGLTVIDAKAEMRRSPSAGRAPLFPNAGSTWNDLGVMAGIGLRWTELGLSGVPSQAGRLVLDRVSIEQPASGGDAVLLDMMNLLWPVVRFGSNRGTTRRNGDRKRGVAGWHEFRDQSSVGARAFQGVQARHQGGGHAHARQVCDMSQRDAACGLDGHRGARCLTADRRDQRGERILAGGLCRPDDRRADAGVARGDA